MGAMLYLAAKDLRLLLRDRMGFFFTFFFPLLMSVFFGTVFSGGGDDTFKGMPIAVVDEDKTPESERFIKSLSEGGEFEVEAIAARDAASDLVRRGQRTAFVALPAGFGQASRSFMGGQPMQIVVGVDPSRKAEAGMIRGLLMARAYRRMQDLFTDPVQGQAMANDALARMREATDLSPAQRLALEPFLLSLHKFLGEMPQAESEAGGASNDAQAFNPVDIQEVAVVAAGKSAPNPYALSFAQGMIWGLIGCSASFGIALVVERTRRTLARLQVAPLHDWQIIGGKALACFLTTITITSVLVLIARVGFGVRPASPGLLVAAILCCGAAFVGIMMLMSVMGRTEAAAAGIGWAVMMVMAMSGGGMIPLMFMPRWMTPISHFSPVKWAVLAIEGALWRGFTWQEMLLPCGILLAIGTVGFLLGTTIFRRIQAP
jgi:ABC-2 type transport system permease protein